MGGHSAFSGSPGAGDPTAALPAAGGGASLAVFPIRHKKHQRRTPDLLGVRRWCLRRNAVRVPVTAGGVQRSVPCLQRQQSAGFWYAARGVHALLQLRESVKKEEVSAAGCSAAGAAVWPQAQRANTMTSARSSAMVFFIFVFSSKQNFMANGGSIRCQMHRFKSKKTP